jgi:hypothetical protein
MPESRGTKTGERLRAPEEIEAIRKLKARYFRLLDTKLWDEMVGCFTADAVLAEHERNIFVEGGTPIVEFLKQGLGADYIVTVHHGHNAEIELTSDTTAKATWALNDYLLNRQTNKGTRGYGYYEDEYVKEKGEWKIKRTTVKHVHREKFKKED